MECSQILKSCSHNPRRITKAEREFAKKLDFKNIKNLLKIRDVRKIVKKNSIGISVLSCENKEKHSIYVSKNCCEEKHADLLLIGEEGKIQYVFIKDLILSYMIILYIVEENIFVVIVYKVLVQKK